MKQAFVFETVAVLVGPWHEPADPPERGARIEVRLLDAEPARGTFSAAQRVVIGQPLFRADLFDRLDRPVGNLERAHFHPRFDGVEPCDRVWPRELHADPTGWLAAELNDLEGLATRAGLAPAEVASLSDDAAALRKAVPDVVRAVESAWRDARSSE